RRFCFSVSGGALSHRAAATSKLSSDSYTSSTAKVIEGPKPDPRVFLTVATSERDGERRTAAMQRGERRCANSVGQWAKINDGCLAHAANIKGSASFWVMRRPKFGGWPPAEKGRIVIFAAGTGNPYFTTDTAATLRAMEMNCDAIFKGTQVDGVYDSDPKVNADAIRYEDVTYDEVLNKNLKVMDASAIALARDNNLPIVVFSLHHEGGMMDVLHGRGRYTTVHV
ncbi:MAG: hypothetical protein AAF317_00795, partial [Pseudomonadota bacterium]